MENLTAFLQLVVALVNLAAGVMKILSMVDELDRRRNEKDR